MKKEKILKEFERKFIKDGDFEHGYFDIESDLVKDLRKFLSQSLAQIHQEARKETLAEIGKIIDYCFDYVKPAVDSVLYEKIKETIIKEMK